MSTKNLRKQNAVHMDDTDRFVRTDSVTEAVIRLLAKRAERPLNPGDYQDPQDGLMHCGTCRKAKQSRLKLPDGKTMLVPSMCTCQEQQYEREQAEKRKREAREHAEQLRYRGIRDEKLRACRFETAQDSPAIRRCQRYVDCWEQAQENDLGLMLWGKPGGGKTFAAACIANALIDRGISVMITSISLILRADFNEHNAMLERIWNVPLLILDDFGAERKDSSFAQEITFDAIDGRYRSGKPLIITTNLSQEELQNPKNTAQQRVYGRILELCVPVKVPPASYRTEAAIAKLNLAQKILLD